MRSHKASASNLYTIDFSDSSEEESEEETEYESEEEEDDIIQVNIKRANIFRPSPIVKKKQPIGDIIEISDSYSTSSSSSSEKSDPKIQITKKKVTIQENVQHKNDSVTPKEEKSEPKPPSQVIPNNSIEKQQKQPEPNNNLQKRRFVNWPVYLVKRKKVTSIKGTRIFFTFEENSQALFSAKCKSSSPSKILIDKGTDVHLSSKPDAEINVENNVKDFFLENKSTGEMEVAARFSPPKWPADTARKLEIEFLKPKQGTPEKMESQNPPLSPNGKPIYDFGGHFAFDSVKNAVLYGSDKNQKLMIRKVGDNEIEIEAWFENEPIWLFAIGIGSFLADA
ncbi:hypothetical protein GPJ56_003270 [Histomonas meleagridis]|uniref:uncharacterized protein n=1 Tax=Histomonas meleagridis TaxID=135588 RepID=UPI00355A3893|nr:hypothetical protein GPJ56_003270 [Histomonas meleagridis]KAH0805931.1 hypothetical protein GO595_001262 [Histomonas meleagridis]